MHAPPDPQSERAPLPGRPKSQKTNQRKREIESDTSPLDFQASRLVRLYALCHATARTIAALAFAGCPR
jgi:hypothetical protein